MNTSLLDGQQALFGRLDRPVDPRVWVADDSTGPAGVALLGNVGVTSTVVDALRLTDARPPGGESGFTRPVTVRGGSGATLAATVLDPELQRLLDTAADPALSAHRIVTQLIGAWLADDRERGTVLRIDDTADLGVVAALCTILQSAPSERPTPISVVAPAEVAGLPPLTTRQSGREVRWERDLVAPDDVPDVGRVAERLGSARRLVDDYAAIVPPSDPAATRDAILIQRSLDRRVSVDVQERLLASVVGAMRADLGRLTASKPRTLTVISRDTTVPLRLTNGMGRAVKVRLRLKSPRLVFRDGAEQTLTLEPGLNRFDVRVDVRASGQFVMQAEVVAPASDRVLASTRQTIRSRTFSGVGLMLSGGALLFLVIWWSRTLRNRERPRRDHPDATDGGPDDEPDDEPRAAADAPGVPSLPS